ncbi:hypothetical protein C7H62_0346 [Mesoflavibacter sp. HG96]|uniref:T9SS type A sorting domain-containing protein n=1 Tax=unclassified Mesoflavibacter TaxID=2630131 RepID=UPI000D0E6BDD|nr:MULTISPECIES: T9SS type A sorting domain-containing protein [unclassified Mesoflavibacter]QIJ88156.1 hypothetical protein C7H62_0346 [Mesoflavibacter sp. HG96]QIJ90884.1 hypothetical protein C7H56_0346 [Mesoflavibacter sp. HG37]
MIKILLNFSKSLRLFLPLFLITFSIQSHSNTNSWCGDIYGFKFKNGNTSVAITNNATYSINELPNNFYVQLIVSGYSQSAKFYLENLSTGATYNLTENYAPYTFPGGGSAWNYGAGVFKLKAKLYKYNYGNGWACDIKTVQFTLSNASSCGEIDGFVFSNGNSTLNIDNNTTYQVGDLPIDFYIESLTSGNSESVQLKLKNLDTGYTYNVGENYEPYTIPGGGSVWNYGYGNFKLTAKLYAYDYCQSTICDEKTIYFTLDNTVDCATLTGLEFTNGTDSLPLVDNQAYSVTELPNNFYINAQLDGTVSKIKYYVTNLDTNNTVSISESVAPYTFPSTGNSWNLGAGNFQIKAKLYTSTINYSGNNCGSSSQTYSLCDTYIYNVTITDPSVCGSLDSFVFTDGTLATPIENLQTYNILDLPESFYINTLTSGAVDKVKLEVTNLDTNQTYNITENYMPYTFPAGENPWDLGLGNFKITAKIYALQNNSNGCKTTGLVNDKDLNAQNASYSYSGGYNGGSNNNPVYSLCEEQTIYFTLIEESPCNLIAGTGTLSVSAVVIPLGGTFNLTVTPNGDAQLEDGYVLGTVLASVGQEVIYAVSNDLVINLPYLNGPFNVHMFAYDPNTFDFSTIAIGVDTITDVQNSIVANTICADLSNAGSQIVIIPGGLDQRTVNTEEKPKAETKSKLEQLVTAKETEDNLNVEDIKLYPNPAIDYLNIKIRLNEGEIFNYSITDLNGKQVNTGVVNSSLTTINTKLLAEGLYVLKLQSGYRTITKKIVVKK